MTGVKAVNPKYEVLGHLSVPLDDLKRFRQLGSRCPGHPEYRWTSGVEATTGPLGQGLAMSAGMTIAARWKATYFNRRSGGLEEREVPRGCARRCADRYAEMGEDLGDDGGVEDGGEDRQGTAAVGAMFHIDIEHPLEQLGQLMRADAEGWSVSPWPGGLSTTLAGGLGMIWGGSLALGASTP